MAAIQHIQDAYSSTTVGAVTPTLVGGSTVTAMSSTSASIQATGFTVSATDTVLVAIITFESPGTWTSVSTVEATGAFGGISFTQRSGVNGLASGHGNQRNEIWYATAAASFSSASVAATFASDIDDAAMVVFAVSGCNLVSPWDTNSSLTATSTASGTCTVSTNSNQPFMIMVGAQNTNISITAPAPSGSGIATVTNDGGSYWQYLTVDYYTPGTALSSVSVGYTGGLSAGFYQITVDALVPVGGGSSSLVVPLGSSVAATDTLIASVCLSAGASVASITDTIGGRWIQAAFAYGSQNGSEIWMARGVAGGTASVTITTTSTSYATVGANVSEWSNLQLAAPLDRWSQNNGLSTHPTAVAVTPRSSSELCIGVVSASASISAIPSSFTALTESGSTGFAAAYIINSASQSRTPQWTQNSSATWAVAAAFFQSGITGYNPDLQFPETLVQICTLSNWQAPLTGIGVWTDISSYVQSMSLGPIGRQHELDRIQAAPAQITLDNRYGQFNPWNTSSFLYNSGSGLKPMNPVRVVAAWNGTTSPMYYGYFQSITNSIKSTLDVDAQMNCIDILQLMSLKYLANDNYAQLVQSDGGSHLQAYYRLGDVVGAYTVKDSSGYGATGSLISGPGGVPSYGQTGPFLYDPSTALDLTNGTQALNGGIETIDLTTQVPSVKNPLSGASSWTLELWEMWTSSTALDPGSIATLSQGSGTSGQTYLVVPYQPTPTGAVGNLIVGPGIPVNTFITGVAFFFGTIYSLSNPLTSSPSNQTYTLYQGGVGSTLWSLDTPVGTVDVRAGIYTSASVSTYNGIIMGPTPVGTSEPILAIGQPVSQSALDGNWHHIVVTYSASVASVYIDGSLDYSAPTGGSWADPTAITIGADAGVLNGFVGTISDVAMYSEVLTATQIANHYATGIWFQTQTSTAGMSTSRMIQLLEVIGFPTSAMNVPYPWKTELYGSLGQPNSGSGNQVTLTSGLNYIQSLSETEPGIIYQGPNGQLYCYNRQYQYLNPTSTTSQGVFGDNISTAAYHYEGTSFTMGQDDLDIFNDIQVQSGRGGYTLSATNAIAGGSQEASAAPFTVGGGQLQEWGPAQSSSMATSASVYGARTLQGLTSLYQEYDSDCLAIAQNYAAWYGFPICRVQQMTLNSYADGGTNIPQMLQRNIMDTVTIQYQGQVAGPQFSQNSVIESISHQVTMSPGPTWATTMALSPYEILMYPTYLGVWTFGNPAADGVLTL